MYGAAGLTIGSFLWHNIPFGDPQIVKRTKSAFFTLDMVVKNRHIALFTHIPEQLPK